MTKRDKFTWTHKGWTIEDMKEFGAKGYQVWLHDDMEKHPFLYSLEKVRLYIEEQIKDDPVHSEEIKKLWTKAIARA